MSRRGWLIALVLMVGLAVLTAIPIAATQDATQQSPNLTLAQNGVLTDVYNQVSPSVVAINVVARQPNVSAFGQGGSSQVAASGSGFVIDGDGHIMTNNHVVDGATSIEVNFLDGTLARATIVGVDPDSDLAVLQVQDVPADKLHPITWGDSDALQIGQPVLAIGSPFGERWTLTEGIVSALDRTIQGLTNFSIGGVIQTDAAINPGNSGGPLLDLAGHVIGVNSQIISPAGTNAGVGFAIPSNLTRKVSQALIQNGSVSYSYLGISGGDVSLPLIDALKIPNDTRGVVVGDVTPGSPAAKAGLQAAARPAMVDGQQVPTSADIITAINGQPLTGIGSLISYLAKNTQPGDEVTLSILRDGTQTLQLSAQLTLRP